MTVNLALSASRLASLGTVIHLETSCGESWDSLKTYEHDLRLITIARFQAEKGLGTSLQIMGLAAIDPVIKCTTSFTRSPSLVQIDPIVSKVQPFENIKIYPENVRPSGLCVRMTKYFCVILALLNGCISVKTSLINTKRGNFVNLGVLFLTIWINSC